jgi:hypothetical protein
VIAAALVAAAAVTFPLPRHADAVAFGGGRVVWTTAGGDGPVIVNAAPPSGGVPQVLATIPTSSGAIAVTLAVNASGVGVAVRSGREDKFVLIDGAPRTLLDCDAPAADDAPDLIAAAGATGFAVSGARCPDRAAVRTIAADGTVTPVAGLRGVSALAYSEPYLAVDGDDDVVELNLATGARRAPGPFFMSPFAVLPDGTMALSHSDFEGIYLWAPGAAKPQLITPGTVQNGALLAASPGALLYEPLNQVHGRTALALTGLGATGITSVGVPGAGGPRTPLFFDGTTAAFRGYSCTGGQQVAVVDVTSPPRGVPGCPVKVLDRRARRTVRVSCPNGCRGRLLLSRVPPPDAGCVGGGTGCRAVASASLAGGGRVRLRFTAYGRRVVRHPVRVFAALDDVVGPELVGFPRLTLRR